MLPKWPKGSDCKSDCFAFGGSNPSHATREKPRDPRDYGAVFVTRASKPHADSISALPLALPASPAVDEAPSTFDDMVRRGTGTGIVDVAGATGGKVLDAYATKTNTPPAAAN
jgi:hypothetical protein